MDINPLSLIRTNDFHMNHLLTSHPKVSSESPQKSSYSTLNPQTNLMRRQMELYETVSGEMIMKKQKTDSEPAFKSQFTADMMFNNISAVQQDQTTTDSTYMEMTDMNHHNEMMTIMMRDAVIKQSQQLANSLSTLFDLRDQFIASQDKNLKKISPITEESLRVGHFESTFVNNFTEFDYQDDYYNPSLDSSFDNDDDAVYNSFYLENDNEISFRRNSAGNDLSRNSQSQEALPNSVQRKEKKQARSLVSNETAPIRARTNKSKNLKRTAGKRFNNRNF